MARSGRGVKTASIAAVAFFWASGLGAAPLVLLDPGHGGADTGVIVSDFHESDFVLSLAKRVQLLLKARGVETKLTRDGDQYLSLTARVDLANALRPIAMVSLHVNGAFQPEANGPRLFVPAEVKVDEPEAPLWEQAAGMHAAASRTLGFCLAKALATTGPRPVQTLKLAIFRGLAVPVCLVELDFATNPQALAALTDAAAGQVLADKLAAGIADYVLGPPGNDHA